MKNLILAVQITIVMAASVVAMRAWILLGANSDLSPKTVAVLVGSFIVVAALLPARYRAVGLGAVGTLVGASGLIFVITNHINRLLDLSGSDLSGMIVFGAASLVPLIGGATLLRYGSRIAEKPSQGRIPPTKAT